MKKLIYIISLIIALVIGFASGVYYMTDQVADVVQNPFNYVWKLL